LTIVPLGLTYLKKKKEKKERRIMDSGKERQEAGVIKAGEDCKCKGK
jgi:hypothetical protein